mgnify:CR=1 FL=1
MTVVAKIEALIPDWPAVDRTVSETLAPQIDYTREPGAGQARALLVTELRRKRIWPPSERAGR